MSSPSGFREIASRELGNEYSRIFLKLLSEGFAILRSAGMSTFEDPQEALDRSRAIRRDAVERMPELLEEFARAAGENGAVVLWARDARHACDQIVGLARERGVRFVAKGKSMITEEIGLNRALEESGVEVFETDLGEFVTQTMGLPPFHLVGPAINIPPDKIGEAFFAKGVIREPDSDPVRLGKAVRAHLREKFRALDMGVVGVNMAIASTGTLVNVENEGNIRMIKSSPRTLVAVMSIEKVVPTLEDALHLLRVLCRNCTGQKMSGYVTFDSGPAGRGEKDGPEELFVVIVDNKRSAIYQDPLARQVLRCIRCGACLNTCPVYARIGGYPYGGVYSGPMGAVLSPLLHGIERTSDLFRACTLCGACRQVCPAGIDHPELIRVFRQREVEAGAQAAPGAQGAAERAALGVLGLCASHPAAWMAAVRSARLACAVLGEGGYVRKSPFGLSGWFSSRDLPAVAARTFREWWKGRDAAKGGRGPGGGPT